MNLNEIISAINLLGVNFNDILTDDLKESLNELKSLKVITRDDYANTRHKFNVRNPTTETLIINLFNVTELKDKLILLNELHYRSEI